MNKLNEIKKDIKTLRKFKRSTSIKSKERRDINKKIRTLKEQLNQYSDIQNTDEEKENIIKEILKLRPDINKFKTLDWSLEQYTKEQLKRHLEIFKQKRHINE